MPNPKRRHSCARQAKRRANYKAIAPGLSTCPQCKAPKLPHRVCPSCGYYNGKAVVIIEEKEDKKKK